MKIVKVGLFYQGMQEEKLQLAEKQIREAVEARVQEGVQKVESLTQKVEWLAAETNFKKEL